MKTAAIEVENAGHAFARKRFIADLFELVKARLTSLVLLTTAVGFYLGSGPSVDYAALFRVVFGTAAAAAGAAALNQWWERKADALMHRTRMRPVPAGRMRPAEALALGLSLSIFGVGYLAVKYGNNALPFLAQHKVEVVIVLAVFVAASFGLSRWMLREHPAASNA